MGRRRARGVALAGMLAVSGGIMLSCGDDPPNNGVATGDPSGGTAGNAGAGGANVNCASDDDCDADSYCDVGEARCAADKKTGQPCDENAADAGDNQCVSNHCADGLCCEIACDRACEACSAAKSGGTDGVCSAIPAGEDPDGDCPTDDSLCQAGSCSGRAGSCTPAAEGVSCRSVGGGCDNQTEQCDGLTAACPSDDVLPSGHQGLGCGPYACDGVSPTCPDSCTTNADCRGGFACDMTCEPWRAVTTGAGHTCGVVDPRKVLCRGYGQNGRLGYADQSNIGDTETPASAGAVDVGGTVAQIAAGGLHTCALLDTGKVHCWGSASYGQLGYGNTDPIGDTETPASAGAVDVGGTVVQIAAGELHTCALLDTGKVHCWGSGSGGRLGYGNESSVGDGETPASVGAVDVGGTVVQIAAGEEHTCALLDTGEVHCWGHGQDGRLGYGNQDDVGDGETPASVGPVDVGGTVVQIATGSEHTCALLDTGKVRCWGEGDYGRLGYFSNSNVGVSNTPASVGNVIVGALAIQITAGEEHTCALLDTGKVRCWGRGIYGALGYGNSSNVGDNHHPGFAGDVDVGGTVIQIAAGREHTCALLESGSLRCWGRGTYGRLGYGNNNTVGNGNVPADVGDVPWE